MVEQVVVVVEEGAEVLERLALRYGLLERVAASTLKQDVAWLAFGLEPETLRFVFDGSEEGVNNVLRGLRVGTTAEARAQGMTVRFGCTERTRVHSVEDAVVWAHSAGSGASEGPLASPWTSHRDLLGFRTAAFFDARALRARVDAAAVHRRTGGLHVHGVCAEPVPDATPHALMRVSAAVLGRLPSDRRTFALFTQVARVCGFNTAEVADALMLTRRRVRQLAHAPSQPVETALWVLQDPRLSVVP